MVTTTFKFDQRWLESTPAKLAIDMGIIKVEFIYRRTSDGVSNSLTADPPTAVDPNIWSKPISLVPNAGYTVRTKVTYGSGSTIESGPVDFLTSDSMVYYNIEMRIIGDLVSPAVPIENAVMELYGTSALRDTRNSANATRVSQPSQVVQNPNINNPADPSGKVWLQRVPMNDDEQSYSWFIRIVSGTKEWLSDGAIDVSEEAGWQSPNTSALSITLFTDIP